MKLKSIFKWIGWFAGFVSRFLPSNIKVWALALSTLSGGVVTLLDSCDKPKSPSDPLPATPSPTPTPVPTPTPIPKPELRAPKYVKATRPFLVELCNTGNLYQVDLYVDGYRLGYMGFGNPCMRLTVILHSRGDRTLIAKLPNQEEFKKAIIVE